MDQKQAKEPDGEKGSYSATIGLVCFIALAVGLIWHDRQTVDAVLATAQVVNAAEERLAGFTTAEPEDAVLVRVMADMEKVVAAGGGADCSPLFDLLGREGTLRGARTNVGTALAIQARSEVLKGDLDAAVKAAKRFEEATKDDLLPSKVEAWVWRINEIADHPGSRKLDRARMRRALFADKPVDEALKD